MKQSLESFFLTARVGCHIISSGVTDATTKRIGERLYEAWGAFGFSDHPLHTTMQRVADLLRKGVTDASAREWAMKAHTLFDREITKLSVVVVTRHPGLVEWLIRANLINQDTPVIAHATVDDVLGKHVIGVLPMSLACHVQAVTEVALTIPAEMRGKELSIDQVEEYQQGVVTYKVTLA